MYAWSRECAKPGNITKIVEAAAEAVKIFNDLEITSCRLSASEYQHFMICHLVLNDTTNAKFLWKRIPKGIREDPQSNPVKELWAVSKDLSKRDYEHAFDVIRGLSRSLTAEQNGLTLKLLEILHNVLREHHALNDIKQAY
jgi:hypothetical protein